MHDYFPFNYDFYISYLNLYSRYTYLQQQSSEEYFDALTLEHSRKCLNELQAFFSKNQIYFKSELNQFFNSNSNFKGGHFEIAFLAWESTYDNESIERESLYNQLIKFKYVNGKTISRFFIELDIFILKEKAKN